MESAGFTTDKILTFLNNLGYGFSSDRAMIDHCRDGKNLLKVIVEVIRHFQPAYLRSILAMQCHRISQDLDKHRQSLPFTSDFLVAKEIFKTTNFQLRLSDIIHPNHPNQSYQNNQNSREMAILGHLYSLWNWNKKVQISNQVIFGRLKLLQKEQKNLRQEEGAVTSELFEVERTKMMEKPAFLEKTKLIANIKQEVAQIRSQKNQLAALKVERDKEIIDKARQYQQCLYRIQKLQIEISQAKKELSINAPQVRKQKLRQDAALQEAIAKKQHQSNYILKMRHFLENKMNILDGNLGKLKNLSPIEHLQNRSNNLKNHSKRLKQDQAYKLEGIKKLEKEMQNIETGVKDQQKKEEEEKGRINELFITKSRLKEVLQNRNEEIKKMNEEISKLKQIYRDTKSKIQEIERQNNEQANACDHELKKLIRQAEQWNKSMLSSFHESHRALDISFYTSDEISNKG